MLSRDIHVYRSESDRGYRTPEDAKDTKPDRTMLLHWTIVCFLRAFAITVSPLKVRKTPLTKKACVESPGRHNIFSIISLFVRTRQTRQQLRMHTPQREYPIGIIYIYIYMCVYVCVYIYIYI